VDMTSPVYLEAPVVEAEQTELGVLEHQVKVMLVELAVLEAVNPLEVVAVVVLEQLALEALLLVMVVLACLVQSPEHPFFMLAVVERVLTLRLALAELAAVVMVAQTQLQLQ
jgi:hypothetical protein